MGGKPAKEGSSWSKVRCMQCGKYGRMGTAVCQGCQCTVKTCKCGVEVGVPALTPHRQATLDSLLL
eukprot:792336-Alexandrium_andersonii.AAC.1